MDKIETAKKFNEIMEQARRAAHNLLKSEKYDIGTVDELWRFLLPDDGKTMMTHAGMRDRNRCIMVANTFYDFINTGAKLKPKQLVSEAEVQEKYNAMMAKDREFEKVKETSEYKEYIRLFNKFKKYL